MKHLFMVRHGKEYSPAELGQQFAVVANQMIGIYHNLERSLYLCSSHQERAVNSMKIIAEMFGVREFDKFHELAAVYEERHLNNTELESIHGLIRPHIDASTVIAVVTHNGTIGDYFSYLMEKEYGVAVEKKRFSEGTGIHLDAEARYYELFPRFIPYPSFKGPSPITYF